MQAAYLQTEVEIDLDTKNPYEVRVYIKSRAPMSTEDLADALRMLLDDIIEPELKKTEKQKKSEKGH